MSNIKIAALGGVRETGKNIYIVEVNDAIFVLDCGLVVAHEELLGIDHVIPDLTYLIENKDRVAGLFLTHGHDDAIGAVPYFLQEIEVPVFGTEFTIELAKMAYKHTNNRTYDEFHVIDANKSIAFEEVNVTFFSTTHPIPDSIGIVLETEEGSIVYTGDFKFDWTVKEPYETKLGRLTDIGEKGVLALLSDSTNAESQIENATEHRAAQQIIKGFRDVQGRVLATLSSSNILRVQQIIDAAHKTHRHIFILDEKMQEIYDLALKLEKIKLPSEDLVKDIKDISSYDDRQIVVLVTGTEAEPLNELLLMAQHKHPDVHIKDGDVVFIATGLSLAVETLVAETKDAIYRADGQVIDLTKDLRVSGHATPQDLMLMIKTLNPKYFIPVNGEYRMQAAHAKIANQLGMDYQNIFILGKGDVLDYSHQKMTQSGQIHAGNILVDGSGVGDIGNVVLRDRKLLSEDGIFVVIATISRREKKILAGPVVISRGFIYMKTSEELLSESNEQVTEILNKHLQSNDFEWAKLKQEIRENLNKFLFEKTKRRPMILPILMEASSYQSSKS